MIKMAKQVYFFRNKKIKKVTNNNLYLSSKIKSLRPTFVTTRH